MRKIAAIAACVLVLAVAACGTDSSASQTSPSSATTTVLEKRADTAQCDEFCARSERIADEKCESGATGSECGDILTSKVMLAMEVRDSDSATTTVRESASRVVDSSSDWTDAKCHLEASIAGDCGFAAMLISTNFTTLNIRLHTP